jgi:hypothetical protein
MIGAEIRITIFGAATSNYLEINIDQSLPKIFATRPDSGGDWIGTVEKMGTWAGLSYCFCVKCTVLYVKPVGFYVNSSALKWYSTPN